MRRFSLDDKEVKPGSLDGLGFRSVGWSELRAEWQVRCMVSFRVKVHLRKTLPLKLSPDDMVNFSA